MLRASDTPAIRDRIISERTPLPGLRKFPMYWVSESMGRLVSQQVEHMPDWSPSMCRPAPSGLMVFPIPSAHSMAMQSTVFTWMTLDSGDMEVVAYDSIGGLLAETIRVTLPADATLPLPEGEIIHPEGKNLIQKFRNAAKTIDHVQGSMTHIALQSMGCAWIMMQQPTLAGSKRVRGAKVPGRRAPKKPEIIQYITLRKIPTNAAVEHPSAHEGREYHVRWWVKGHWRQQAVGVGRKLRRPVYIAPHIKGPEGAPLKTERVHKWTR